METNAVYTRYPTEACIVKSQLSISKVGDGALMICYNCEDALGSMWNENIELKESKTVLEDWKWNSIT